MSLLATVLVVDDDRRDNKRYCRLLQAAGHEVTAAYDVAQALELIDQQDFDVVVLDMLLPIELNNRLDFGGFEVLRRVQTSNPTTQVIAVTGYGSRELAAQATAAGAIDYITKDTDTAERLPHSVRVAAVKAHELRTDPDDDDDDALTITLPQHLIANSPAMQQVLRKAQRLAARDVTVLITGEPGVGKELIASVLHINSAYATSGRYNVAICRDLSPGLPELYGKDDEPTSGLLATTNGGTLVIRRVDMLPFNQQKLLVSVIKEKQYRPVGASQLRSCDVRIIVTASGNLEQMVQRGKFWRPLYDVLSRYKLHVPPLRERRQDDLTAIAGYLLHTYELAVGLTDAAIQQLVTYDYARDNIRELEEILRRAALITDDTLIDSRHLPSFISAPAANDNQGNTSQSKVKPRVLTTEEQEEAEHLQQIISAKRRRMRVLEVQAAEQGRSVSPMIVIEIEDLRREIAEIEQYIQNLGKP